MNFHRIARALLLSTVLGNMTAMADDWPQWLGPRRDGVWREDGILKAFPDGGPKRVWSAPIHGGYAGPAVGGGRVYVMDRQHDGGTGQGGIPGTERVLCLNESDGSTVWSHEYRCHYTMSYPSGPRTTPVIDEGRVYTLGAEGHLFCFDAESGKPLWIRHFEKDFGVKTPQWGYAAHPLIDGDNLICLVGGEGSVAVAFDKRTGKERWRSLSAREPGYAPPMLIEAGGRRQLIVWHPEAINSLDPATGEVFWTLPWAIQSGLSVPTPRHSGDFLFFTCFYNGSTLLRLDRDRPGFSKVWQTEKASERDTTHLHSIIGTPVIEDGIVYGVCSYGQFRAMRLADGKRLWETMEVTTGDQPDRWANVFVVNHEDRYFLFNEKGDLIISRLSADGYEEVSRARLLEATNTDVRSRKVVWSHPAFANRRVYARNDEEIVCVSLAANE